MSRRTDQGANARAGRRDVLLGLGAFGLSGLAIYRWMSTAAVIASGLLLVLPSIAERRATSHKNRTGIISRIAARPAVPGSEEARRGRLVIASGTHPFGRNTKRWSGRTMRRADRDAVKDAIAEAYSWAVDKIEAAMVHVPDYAPVVLVENRRVRGEVSDFDGRTYLAASRNGEPFLTQRIKISLVDLDCSIESEIHSTTVSVRPGTRVELRAPGLLTEIAQGGSGRKTMIARAMDDGGKIIATSPPFAVVVAG